MVSKARLDLPEPDRPVMTVRLSRGMSTSIALEVVLARAADGNMGQHRLVSRSSFVLVIREPPPMVNAASHMRGFARRQLRMFIDSSRRRSSMAGAMLVATSGSLSFHQSNQAVGGKS